MAYLYETHLHTSQASACGKSLGREFVRRYRDAGYTGIIITDHFYHGNSAIDKNLPWKKWVNRFCEGYEDAREEGEKQGLDVFFGWEETFDGDDYLVYGLDKDWLLEHPESLRWSVKQQFEDVKRYGGCVVQAHPFRQYYYINRISLSPDCVDAVEAGNAANEPSFDALAWKYAREYKLPVTAGSDKHIADTIVSEKLFGIYMDKKMESIKDYVNALCEAKKDLRRCNITGLKVPAGRFDSIGEEKITLPLEIRNKKSR